MSRKATKICLVDIKSNSGSHLEEPGGLLCVARSPAWSEETCRGQLGSEDSLCFSAQLIWWICSDSEHLLKCDKS